MPTLNEQLIDITQRTEVLQQQVRAVRGDNEFVATIQDFTVPDAGNTGSVFVEDSATFAVDQRVQIGHIVAGVFRGGTFRVDSVEGANEIIVETQNKNTDEDIPSGSRIYPVGSIVEGGSPVPSYSNLGAAQVEDPDKFADGMMVVLGNTSFDQRGGGLFKIRDNWDDVSSDAGVDGIYFQVGASQKYLERIWDGKTFYASWFGCVDGDDAGLAGIIAFWSSRRLALVIDRNIEFNTQAHFVPPSLRNRTTGHSYGARKQL
jgi:hypothetical protein